MTASGLATGLVVGLTIAGTGLGSLTLEYLLHRAFFTAMSFFRNCSWRLGFTGGLVDIGGHWNRIFLGLW